MTKVSGHVAVGSEVVEGPRIENVSKSNRNQQTSEKDQIYSC